MYRVNSCRHPRHLELIVTWVCVCVHCGLFLCEQLRNNSSSTNNAQRSRTIAPLTAFVCGGGETGNEIMLRALAVCAQSLSKSGARPGGEYQSLISRPRRAYGNEEQFNVSKQGGICGYTRRCPLSPAFYLSPIFSLCLSLTWFWPSLNATKYHCETAHTKVMANHLSQHNSPFPSYLRYLPSHFTSSYSIWRLHRGHRVKHCYRLPKHLPFFSSTPPLFCVHS